jgi:hypothetical protein
MNDKPSQPGADPLAAWLREARAIRPLPTGFPQAVWRRIEKAEVPQSTPSRSWIDQWADLLMRPKWALAGAAVVILAGCVVGIHDGMTGVNQLARDRYLTAVAPMRVR